MKGHNQSISTTNLFKPFFSKFIILMITKVLKNN